MATCNIFFTNRVFHPGNVVEGVVEFRATTPMHLETLSLKFTGKERVRIQTQVINEDKKKMQVMDKERLLFFKQTIKLLESSADISPGVYHYPFAYKLPNDLPSSLSFRNGKKSEFAEIIYYAKVLYSSSGVKNKVREYFSVLRPVSKKQYMDERGQCIVKHATELVSCGCCGNGTAILQYYVARKLVVADRDAFQIVVDVDNGMGKKAVKRVKVKLIREIFYRSRRGHGMSVERVGKEVLRQPVAPGNRMYVYGMLNIPHNTLPSLQTFNIQICYRLVIEVVMSGGRNPKYTTPVYIVPTMDEKSTFEPLSFEENLYRNMKASNATVDGYKPPSRPVILPNPIPSSKGTLQKLSMDCTKGAMPLPSTTWQTKGVPLVDGKAPRAKKNAVDGPTDAAKQRVPWEGGLMQEHGSDPSKPQEVEFPSGWYKSAKLVPSGQASEQTDIKDQQDAAAADSKKPAEGQPTEPALPKEDAPKEEKNDDKEAKKETEPFAGTHESTPTT